MNQAILHRLTRLDQLFSQFDDICDGAALDIKRSHCEYSAAAFSQHLHDLQNSDRLLTVGIIGRVKAGKSSLINGLLFEGEEVLPKAATPMTAALTTLSYSDSFTAEVCFFNRDDIEQMHSDSQRYQQKLIRLTEDEIARLAERRDVHPDQLDESTLERCKSSARRQLDEREPGLRAMNELSLRVRASGMDINTLPSTQDITAGSRAELNQKLLDYVGADGRMMPFTSSLNIGLPVAALQDLRIVDTPGLNDAMASREQRTYNMLKECNVVFIVSPAGQFLSEQDLELSSRLSNSHGIQEIYLVASQIDTQLHSRSERERWGGDFSSVLGGLKQTLSNAAFGTLKNQDNESLKHLAQNIQPRLFVTSGMAKTLQHQPESSWDDNCRHALQMLHRNYPDDFSQAAMQRSLSMLAGYDALDGAIAGVRQQKEAIITQQVESFCQSQRKSLDRAVSQLAEHFTEGKKRIEQTDLAQVVKRQETLNEVRTRGAAAANVLFQDQIERLDLMLTEQLSGLIASFRKDIQQSVNEAQGQTTRSRTVDKSGFGARFLRAINFGGTETITRTVTTLKASEVRTALEDMRSFIDSGIATIARKLMHQWRDAMNTALIAKLRETVGDSNVDGDQLATVTRRALATIRDLPSPALSELPAVLAYSGTREGNKAEEHLAAAHDFVVQLQQEAHLYAKQIQREVRQIAEIDLGDLIFAGLQQELTKLNDMVLNKRLTLDKMEMIAKAFKELAQ